MADYDIGEAFRAIEYELMASMVRNMKNHRLDEITQGKQWEMWQAIQLKALEDYKRNNRKRFKGQFSRIDKEIETAILKARDLGNMEQEIKILRAMQNGYKPHIIPPQVRDLFDSLKGKSLKEKIDRLLKRNRQIQTDGEFFRLNTKKLDALIRATRNDFARAEQAMLRMADDQYRKIIFNAQVYANMGAGTYEKAVDMATKDFLSRGINSIVYKNGARHTISDYADMAIKTANKRAYLTGEGEKRREWGISTVIMNKRGNPCPKCLPFVGKVLIDDVWSGGSPADGDYPLMSDAMAAGLYHPRCMDTHTTYFGGLDTPGASYTRRELDEIEAGYQADQKAQHARRQAERFERLSEFSLDGENQRRYAGLAEQWNNRVVKYGNFGIIGIQNTEEAIEVHLVGKIDRDIYKCITDDIVTDEVILTDERISHIKERHPNDYERFFSYIPEIIKNPDYIIRANKPNTATILKQISDNGEKFQLVLRILTSMDNPEFKNSVITFLNINERTWNKYLRNKEILYKKK